MRDTLPFCRANLRLGATYPLDPPPQAPARRPSIRLHSFFARQTSAALVFSGCGRAAPENSGMTMGGGVVVYSEGGCGSGRLTTGESVKEFPWGFASAAPPVQSLRDSAAATPAGCAALRRRFRNDDGLGVVVVWTEGDCGSMCWPVDRPATHAAAGAAARGALIFLFWGILSHAREKRHEEVFGLGDSFAVGLGAVAGACVGRGAASHACCRGSGSTRG